MAIRNTSDSPSRTRSESSPMGGIKCGRALRAAASVMCLVVLIFGCRPTESTPDGLVQESTDAVAAPEDMAPDPNTQTDRPPNDEVEPGPEPTHSGTVYLDQGWEDGTREDFYYTTQGSQMVPWEWFLALEQPNDEELFREDSYLASMGHIPQPISPKNPEGLPIGFVLDDDPDAVLEDAIAVKRMLLGPDYDIEDYPLTNRWLGLSCAACHTNDLHYQETAIRIDGGASLSDIETFQNEMASALRQTHDDDAKFLRFAERVATRSGQPFDQVEATALRNRLDAYTGALESVIERNRSEHQYGYARLDAFGAILNQVTSAGLEIPENSKPANAPVSYPFLWDTPELHWGPMEFVRRQSNRTKRR